MAEHPSEAHPATCTPFTIYARGRSCLEPGGTYIEWTGLPSDEASVLAAFDFMRNELAREFANRRRLASLEEPE